MNVDWFGLAALLGIGLVAYLAALTAFVARTLTRPPRRGYAWAVARGVPGDPGEVLVGQESASSPDAGAAWSARPRFREIVIDRGLRPLRAWEVEGLEPAGPAVVLTHGWGDSRVVMLSRLPALMPVCSRVVLWDLPGHGDADAGGRSQCTLGVKERDDLLAVVDHVIQSSPRTVRPSGDRDARVVLMGFSLGAGVSIAAAGVVAQVGNVAGVIAEAPYRLPITPARNVLRQRGLPHRFVLPMAMALLGVWIERDPRGVRWASDRWASRPLPRVRDSRGAQADQSEAQRFEDRAELTATLPPACPLLVLHGECDDICPLEDSDAIASGSSSGMLTVVPGATHLNMWTDDACARISAIAIQSFLRSVVNQSSRPIIAPRAMTADR